MLVFVLMTMMTTAHVMMKVLACSLMLRLSAIWLWAYFATDMGLYFLYKLVRGDVRYWLNLQGFTSWIVSFAARLVIKIIVDFTLIVQFRHSFELGGIYWSFNVVSNQAFCFVSVYLYVTYSDDEREEVVEVMWKVVGCLFIFSILNFGLFIKSIRPEYVWTFFDKQSGWQFIINRFHYEGSDAVKFMTFSVHPSFYTKIDVELMEWLNENWSNWEETRPEWFTAKAISMVPADMLPVTVLEAMGGEDGRRKSIDAMKKEEKLKGGRKQSVRGADLKIILDVNVDDGGIERVGELN